MQFGSQAVQAWLLAALSAVEPRAGELDELDRAVGDGDHGSNLLRGLRAATEIEFDNSLPAAEALKQVGMALVSTVGGASGPLFGTFFLRLGQSWQSPPSVVSLAQSMRIGLDGVVARGRAEVGDATMVDALEPAVAAFEQSAAHGAPLTDALALATQAAEVGAEATRDMVAKRGRASYLGEASRGHLDPGAVSSAMLVRALEETLSDDAE